MVRTPPISLLSRLVVTGGLLLIVAGALVFPSGARTTIQQIQPGDMIFIDEQGLDLSGLSTGGFMVTSLRKYQDDNPTKAVLREVAVSDETSFSLIPAAFGDLLGVYYAFNQTGGPMNSVVVSVPSVSIDAVLANPYHSDSITGLTIPEGTQIAFKITSVDVGSSYHAGSLYPATVDLVLTVPGGAQLTTVQGRDFSGMNLSSQVFYTDDPGRPGSIALEGFGAGTYTVQAKWSAPASFDQQAPDSNVITFTIGSPTPTVVPQPVTTVVTMPATVATTIPTTPAVPPTTVLPAGTTRLPATPASPATTPAGTLPPSTTAAPAGVWPALLSPAAAALLLFLRDRRR